MTSASVPSDVAQFIEQEIASGRYRSEDELVVDAVRVLRELKQRHHRLCNDIQKGIREIEQGQEIELESEAELQQFLNQVKAEGRTRLANDRS